MKKEENKVDFDLSALTLKELITVYNDIINFSKFLDDKKIIPKEKVNK